MKKSPQDFLLQSVLEERFGLAGLRPRQEEVIENLLVGKHTLALLPTGYGKSLCYQLPSQILPGCTIVVSPLIALMQDQLSSLTRRGIRNAGCLNSSMSLDEQERIFAGLNTGELKLLYVAPERFESPRFRKLLSQITVSLLVIDEAHCISQWGHDFRLQYRNFSSHLSLLRQSTVLALTATATARVQKDIVKTLGLPRMHIVRASFDRPNLKFEARKHSALESKEKELLELLKNSKQAAIVYTSSRKEAERIAALLQNNGHAALPYHAGMDSSRRNSNQHRFEKGSCTIIVSTVAFGMGIDKPDISRVIHFNLPPSLEHYFQEAGRAGRDGLPATCSLLYQPKDISTQKWLISKSYPDKLELERIFDLVKARGLAGIKSGEASRLLSIDEAAIMSGLSLLKEQQLIDCSQDGSFFDRTSSRSDLPDMSPLLRRKQLELERLERVVDYAEQVSCRRQSLLDYFGEALQSPCTGCDICHS